MPNWMFGLVLGLSACFALAGEPGYAILPLGVGIMINGQVMVIRGRGKDK